MKASDKPEISKKWWTKEKPADIKGTDLEKALAICETALAAAKKKQDGDTIDAALKSLDDLSEAVDDTIKECAKKKLKDVVTVLEKFDKLIEAQRAELEKAQEKADDEEEGKEDEDEDAKTVFKEEYRGRMIKMLRGGETLQFALGLNKQTPADSCLILCNKRKPERLYKMLKRTGDFANRLLTFGTANGDGKVLQLSLSEDAKEPSQIVKTAKVFFKGHKDLKYRKIRVIASGQTFEEEMEGEEGGPQTAASQSSSASGAAQPAAGSAGEPAAENRRKEFKKARSHWVSVRSKAEQDLEVVKDGIRDHYLHDAEQFPIAMEKMKELDDIFEHLNHDLRDALDDYVSTPLKQQDKLHQKAETARGLLESYTKFVNDSPLLAAIDHKEFADVQIQAPMLAAMRELAKTIA